MSLELYRHPGAAFGGRGARRTASETWFSPPPGGRGLLEEGLLDAGHVGKTGKGFEHLSIARLVGVADTQELAIGAADPTSGAVHLEAPVDLPHPGRAVRTVGDAEFIGQGTKAVRGTVETGGIEA